MRPRKLLSIFIVTLILSFSAEALKAQDVSNRVGVGIMVGEPTGFSLKAWNSDRTAIDLGLAWSLGRYDAINIHADYLWHNFTLFDEIESGRLPAYVGVGGRIIFADDYPDPGESNAIVGARIPVGVDYLFEDAPVGIFLEVAPVVNIIPETDFDVDGAVGIRVFL